MFFSSGETISLIYIQEYFHRSPGNGIRNISDFFLSDGSAASQILIGEYMRFDFCCDSDYSLDPFAGAFSSPGAGSSGASSEEVEEVLRRKDKGDFVGPG